MPHWISKQLSLFDALLRRITVDSSPKAKEKPQTERAKSRGKSRARKTKNQVSDEQLFQIWSSLAEAYFPENRELLVYKVYWSNRRQLRTLASCNIDSKQVRVARELRDEKSEKWLSPLLYHEMCHAVLGDSIRRKGQPTPWHGKEFRALEARNPEVALLDQWIKSGGWATAVRRHRAKEAHLKRRAENESSNRKASNS